MGLLDKKTSGQKLTIRAADWNAILDAARQARDTPPPAPEALVLPRQPGLCKVRNDTGADVPRFGVVGLGVPLVLPSVNEPEFKRQLTFAGVLPVAGTHEGLFAISLVPLALGKIGDAVISGVAPCKLAVPGTQGGWAEIVDGVTAHLASNPAGSARVLWAEASGAERWALVRLADRTAGGTSGTIPGDMTYEGNVTFEGDVTISGDTATLNVANLDVTALVALLDIAQLSLTGLTLNLTVNQLTVALNTLVQFLGIVQVGGLVFLPAARPPANPAQGAVFNDGTTLWYWLGGQWRAACLCGTLYLVDSAGTLEPSGDGGLVYEHPSVNVVTSAGAGELSGDDGVFYQHPTVSVVSSSGAVEETGTGGIVFTPGAPALATPYVQLKADGVLWIDAARTARWTGSGDIAAWDGAATWASWFTQANAPNRPTGVPNGQNGLPIVRFGGARAMSSATAINLSATSKVTVIAAYKPTLTGSSQVLYEHSSNYGLATGGFLFQGANGSDQADVALKGDVGTSRVNSNGTIVGGWHVVSATLDKTLATHEVNVWVDGVASNTWPNDSNNTNAFGSLTGYLGGRAGTSIFMGGDVGEFLIFDRLLTTTERQAWESSLRTKWATP